MAPAPVAEYVPPKRELPQANVDWDYLNALEKLPQKLVAPNAYLKEYRICNNMASADKVKVPLNLKHMYNHDLACACDEPYSENCGIEIVEPLQTHTPTTITHRKKVSIDFENDTVIYDSDSVSTQTPRRKMPRAKN